MLRSVGIAASIPSRCVQINSVKRTVSASRPDFVFSSQDVCVRNFAGRYSVAVTSPALFRILCALCAGLHLADTDDTHRQRSHVLIAVDSAAPTG